jgi:uncharacterized protein YjiS (DUF1127 family)
MRGVQRATNRLCKLRQRLGDADGTALGTVPDKPKWMRWATYDRKIAQLAEVEDRHSALADVQLMRAVQRLIGPTT